MFTLIFQDGQRAHFEGTVCRYQTKRVEIQLELKEAKKLYDWITNYWSSKGRDKRQHLASLLEGDTPLFDWCYPQALTFHCSNDGYAENATISFGQ